MCLAYLCNSFTTCTESSSCIREGGFPCFFDTLWQFYSLCAGGLQTQKEPWWPARQWPGVENWPTSHAWLLASLWCPHMLPSWNTHVRVFLARSPMQSTEGSLQKDGALRKFEDFLDTEKLTSWGHRPGWKDMRCGIQVVEKTNFAVTFDLDLFFITKPLPFSSFLCSLPPLSFPLSLSISFLLIFLYLNWP